MSDEQRKQTGLSVKTLLIAGSASAAAALVIPLLWRPGTVFAAAATPIIVALVTELLRRPVETVSTVKVRRTARGTAILDPPPDEPFDPLAPPSAEDLAVLPESTAPPPSVHRRPLTARQWKLGIATGLIAFAAVAAVFTASELIAGDAVSGGGRERTTFFGGSERKRQEPTPQPENKEKEEKERPTPTPSAEPSATPTPTPTPTATPEPESTATPTPTPNPVPAEPAPTP